MPPIGRLQALKARGYRYTPISLNIPVIGLVLAFGMLLFVCVGVCCCSYRKTAKRNAHSKQRRGGTDREWAGFTQLNSSLAEDPLRERHGAAETKAVKLTAFSEPPAYSTLNPSMLGSPHISQSESEHLLPPTPMTPRGPSPPPPTYNAVR
jgi:hypothetical protein